MEQSLRHASLFESLPSSHASESLVGKAVSACGWGAVIETGIKIALIAIITELIAFENAVSTDGRCRGAIRGAIIAVFLVSIITDLEAFLNDTVAAIVIVDCDALTVGIADATGLFAILAGFGFGIVIIAGLHTIFDIPVTAIGDLAIDDLALGITDGAGGLTIVTGLGRGVPVVTVLAASRAPVSAYTGVGCHSRRQGLSSHSDRWLRCRRYRWHPRHRRSHRPGHSDR